MSNLNLKVIVFTFFRRSYSMSDSCSWKTSHILPEEGLCDAKNILALRGKLVFHRARIGGLLYTYLRIKELWNAPSPA